VPPLSGVIGRPPMPAEAVHRLCRHFTGAAERQRRISRRDAGIAGQPGDPHHPVVLLEERPRCRNRSASSRPHRRGFTRKSEGCRSEKRAVYSRCRCWGTSRGSSSRCSRQTMRIFVSARLHATAAPEAPAPMISTSTVHAGLFCSWAQHASITFEDAIGSGHFSPRPQCARLCPRIGNVGSGPAIGPGEGSACRPTG